MDTILFKLTLYLVLAAAFIAVVRGLKTTGFVPGNRRPARLCQIHRNRAIKTSRELSTETTPMNSWEQEKLKLLDYYEQLRGRAVALEAELGRVLNSLDEVVALAMSRRALEVIVTELCQQILGRKPGPKDTLDGILHQLRGKLSDQVLTSMHHLKNLGNIGAHPPKPVTDTDNEVRAHPKPATDNEVRQAFMALAVVLDWYVEYKGFAEIPSAKVGAPSVPTGVNPYRGLDAFEEKDADRFFGREQFLEEVLWPAFDALAHAPERLLALVGPSGSGKSSVARAGLLPLLKKRLPACHLLVTTPTSHPLEALARTLARQASPHDLLPVGKVQEFFNGLERDEQGLRRIVDLLYECDAVPLVLLLDQFEEIFTLCRDPGERQHYLVNLLHAITDPAPHLYLLLTLRSDFLAESQSHPDFNQALSRHACLVPVLDDAGLRRAITEPARRAGHPLDDGVVQLLMEQSAGREGALPLLQHALTEIWQGFQQGHPAAETLRAIGGVGGALAGRAQAVYQQLSAAEQTIARRSFLKLVQLGEGGADTRRRVTLADLVAQGETPETVRDVLHRFADRHTRFLTFGQEADGRESVEITHDALIVHWNELREWLNANRDDLRLLNRLEAAAKHWDAAGRARGLLWRRPDLDLLRTLAAHRQADFTEVQAAFYRAAIAEARRAVWSKRIGVAALMLLTITAFMLWNQAEKARETADREKIRAESQQLAAKAELLGKQRPNLLSQSVLLATEAMERLPTFEADQALSHGLSLLGPRPAVERSYHVAEIALSPHGKYLVRLPNEGPAQVEETLSGKVIARLIHYYRSDNSGELEVAKISFSDDDRYLATLGILGLSAIVWELPTGRKVFQTPPNRVGMEAITLSADGNLLAIGDTKGTISLWNLAKGKEVLTFSHSDIPVTMKFSPDGKYLAVTSSRGDMPYGPPSKSMVQLWDLVKDQEVAQLQHPNSVTHFVFSPDGKYLATTSRVGEEQEEKERVGVVTVWETATGYEVLHLQHEKAIETLAFSPDSQYLFTGETVSGRVWNVVDGQNKSQFDHGSSLASFDYFNAQGFNLFITAGESDKLLRLWRPSLPVAELLRLEESPNFMALTQDADGQYLATLSHDLQANWQYLAPLAKSLNDNDAVSSFDRLRRDYPYLPQWKIPGIRVNLFRGRILLDQMGQDVTRPNAVISFSDMFSDDVMAANQSLAPVKESLESNKNTLPSFDGVRRDLRLWTVASIRDKLRLAHEHAVGGVRFSPDGRYLATFDLQLSNSKNFPSTSSSEFHIEFNNLGSGSVSIWEVSTRKRLIHLEHAGALFWFDFDSTGKYLATACADGFAHIFDTVTGNEMAHLKHDGWVYRVVFSPDGRYLATISGLPKYDGIEMATIWDWQTGRIIKRLQSSGPDAIAFSKDSQFLAVGGSDKRLHILRVTDGQEVQQLQHDSNISEVAFSPDGRYVATDSGGPSSDEGGATTLWKINEGDKIVLRKHPGVGISVAFSPNGRYVASIDANGTSGVWTTEGGQEIATINGEYSSSGNAKVLFSPDSRYLVAMSGNMARILEVATGKEIARRGHGGGLLDVDFSPDGKYLATGSSDTTAGLWLWRPKDLIDEACARLSRNLTHAEWRQYVGEEVPYHATCANLPESQPQPTLSNDRYHNDGYYRVTVGYDEHGNQIEWNYFDIKGQSTSHKDGYHKKTARYDERGNMIEAAFFDTEGKPILLKSGFHKWTGRYDERGNLIEEAFVDTFGQPIRTAEGYQRRTFVYDDQGRKIEQMDYGLDESAGFAARRIRYDEQGKPIEIAAFDAEGQPMRTTEGYQRRTFAYDDQGRMMEQVDYGFDESYGYTTRRIRYDEKGSPSELAYFDTEGRPVSTEMLVTAVLPDSQGAVFDIRVGDVLTHYAGTELHIDTLAFINWRKTEPADGPAQELRVRRQGKELRFMVRPGLLGLRLEDRGLGVPQNHP